MAGKKKLELTAATENVYANIDNAIAEPETTGKLDTPEMTEQPKPGKGRRPKTYTIEELQAVRESSETGGKKEKHTFRFNMAFKPDVYEYITIMSRVRGESVTEFTEEVFRRSMAENKEIYEMAKKFISQFK